MSSDILLNELQKYGIEYKKDHSLKEHCTFHVGGTCELAIFPSDTEQFVFALRVLDNLGVEFCICGRGSNTLFADEYINKAIVFTENCYAVRIDRDMIKASSGASLIRVANLAAENGLSGMEFASGIPGSIGGAVYMNAGAYSSCMSDVIVKSSAYSRKEQKIMTVEEHCFSYRSSIYKENSDLICLDAEIKLTHSNVDVVRKKMRELSEYRRSKQPIEFPSAGSYFKRPGSDFAGRLIEECGLKGMRVGDAEISVKHAGFIINRGNASFDDILRLEEIVKAKVLADFGVELEREVEIVR